MFGKWTTEILLGLHAAPTAGFEDLRRSLPDISARVLSIKLKELEENGMVRRAIVDARPPRVRYSLTERGWTVAWLARPIYLYLRANPAEPAATADSTPVWATARPSPTPAREPKTTAGRSTRRLLGEAPSYDEYVRTDLERRLAMESRTPRTNLPLDVPRGPANATRGLAGRPGVGPRPIDLGSGRPRVTTDASV
ncbi:Helix-turn-helix, HxlR type domain protein, partial [mine drainage metagenome]